MVGVELTLQGFPPAGRGQHGLQLNLLLDLLLAGVVTCGFAAAYNTAWRHMAMAAAGGMAGHGLRHLALEAGWRLDAATLVGGLGVGVVSVWIARSTKTPVAVISYAGAVTMMPGCTCIAPWAAPLQLSRLQERKTRHWSPRRWVMPSRPPVVALTLGLLPAMRTVQLFAGCEPR